MKKGQMVKCVEARVTWLTVDNVYPILAGEGDQDLLFVNTKIDVDNGFNIQCDDGDIIYSLMDGAHGRFELVGDHDA